MLIQHFNRINQDREFIASLSEIHKEVAVLSADGQCSKCISDITGVATSKVDEHRADIYIDFMKKTGS